MSLDPSCREFRARLEGLLQGRPLPDQLLVLSWHEHLLACEGCRELLAKEEALEALLALLPDLDLPPDLARRLLERLRSIAERAGVLDKLLDADARLEAPVGLAGRVLASLAPQHTTERSVAPLDAVLALDQVATPDGLSARVLRGLREERLPLRPAAPRLRLLSRPLKLALAASLLLAVSAPLWLPTRDTDPEPDSGGGLAGGPAAGAGSEVAVGPTEPAVLDPEPGPDDELLALLDLLAEDRLWESEDTLALDLATSLNLHEEALLGYDEVGEAGASEEEELPEGG